MSFRSGLRRGVSRDHTRQRGNSKEERLPEENWCVWKNFIHSLKNWRKNTCLECRGNSNVRFHENIPLDRQEGNKDIEDMSILRKKICRSCKTAKVKSQILSLLPADNFAFINALKMLWRSFNGSSLLTLCWYEPCSPIWQYQSCLL